MLTITLKNGITHQYPHTNLPLEVVLDRLDKLEIWYLEAEDRFEVYRTSEISHVTIDKQD